MTYVDYFNSETPPDLSALRSDIVDAGDPKLSLGSKRDICEHLHMLAAEFSGRNFLEFYHAGLIVHIRREINVTLNKRRFFQLWHEQGDFLLSSLDSRWLVSACDTLADHGGAPESLAARAGTLFMNTVKLYETERWATSASNSSYKTVAGTIPLFDGMTAYWIGRGNMIKNLFDRVLRAPPCGELIATRILNELIRRACIHDTVFNRFLRVHEREATYFAPRKPRRIALVKDTTGHRHFGHQAGTDAVSQILADAGIDVVHQSRGGLAWSGKRAAISAIKSADVALVLGEDPIEKSSIKARELTAFGPICRNLGKPVFLLNATVRDDADVDDLRAFDHIWVRDSYSGRILRRCRIQHSICGDLSLLQVLNRTTDQKGDTVVVDSNNSITEQMLLCCATMDAAPFLTMERDDNDFCLGLPSITTNRGTPLNRMQPLFKCSGFRQFAGYMGSFDRALVGGLHAVCFALALRMPFHSAKSRATEVEAMLADASLAATRALNSDTGVPPFMPLSLGELEAIDDYIERTRDAAIQLVRRVTA